MFHILSTPVFLEQPFANNSNTYELLWLFLKMIKKKGPNGL